MEDLQKLINAIDTITSFCYSHSQSSCKECPANLCGSPFPCDCGFNRIGDYPTLRRMLELKIKHPDAE